MLFRSRRGDLDIIVTLSWDEPADARHHWKDQLVWVRSGATKIDTDGPVPLVAFSDECMCYRTATEALRKLGRETQLVMTASTMLSLSSAVDAGLGTLVMTRARVRMTQLQCWNDAPLPALPEVYTGIYIRDGENTAPLLELADELAPILRPRPEEAAAELGEVRSLRLAFNKAETLGKQAHGG